MALAGAGQGSEEVSVLYGCGCGRRAPIERLYFCTQCNQVILGALALPMVSCPCSHCAWSKPIKFRNAGCCLGDSIELGMLAFASVEHDIDSYRERCVVESLSSVLTSASLCLFRPMCS